MFVPLNHVRKKEKCGQKQPQKMTESSFRSRFAGMPGSLVAIRVDYGRRNAAFDSVAADSSVGKIKREVKRWKMGHRLGDKPEWNGSNLPEGHVGGAPQRAMQRTLSEYQGVKIDYNYRAATLPDINKTTRFVPKPSKLQIDRSIFLSAKEKELLVDRNVGTTTLLSRREMTNQGMEGHDREAGWNTSVEMAKERTDIYKLRTYEDFREVNKTKSVLDHSKYVPPQKRQVAALKTMREEKLAARELDARTRARQKGSHSAPSGGGVAGRAGQPGGMPPVFKMSNMEQWWDPDFDSKMVATASAVLGRPITLTSAPVATKRDGVVPGDRDVVDP